MFYSNSNKLSQNWTAIARHWQCCKQGKLSSVHGDIFYAHYTPRNPRFTVVLVNGRIESAIKYQELLWELIQNDIEVITYDHPGQGLSSRLLNNPQIGHIDDFVQFSEVLHLVIQTLVLPNTDKWLFMAHSMGGAIVCDYLIKHPESPAKGAFLCAPMLQIETAPYPFWIASGIAKFACYLGFDKHYAIGQNDYQAKPFADNELTQCEQRYQRFRTLYQQQPELQLGGVSFGWLNAAFPVTQKLSKAIISKPLSIASAKYDTIVKSEAHTKFANKHEQCTIQTYAGKHELLCEVDPIRRAVLMQFYEFADSVTLNETGS
ncbi:alpha/beta fold hydrolase [Pseudoalteromonas sp. SMS1]|uniref:alpha/beta fold hydrolase n=1 Tax=Pseudoalteromonas sp. SMS1 TaxID=2908894 RepID=UPI001F24A7E9|nr:alpha/beta fold hydrolase [Pseudoalteromonas sp. SMS1]MCF2860186.1 alpha/beta fold hydrolase [Pseudoalteromonas sp. SMS1]